MKQLLPDKLKALGKIAEIKRIFSIVQKSMKKPEHPSLVVSSGEPGEGKTTLTAGLAISAAKQNGDRILAVDFNWYTPALHKLFDIDMFDDVEEMNGDKTVEELVRHTALENLDILPAPRDFQGNDGMEEWHKEFLQKARDKYDQVYIDTASVFPTNYRMMDPVRISNSASGVVLVALTNVTQKQVVKRASVALETAGANLIGVVANQWQNPIA